MGEMEREGTRERGSERKMREDMGESGKRRGHKRRLRVRTE